MIYLKTGYPLSAVTACSMWILLYWKKGKERERMEGFYE